MIIKKRIITWVGIFVILLGLAVAVNAAIPSISLNSPVSFPVDI